ncbi:hypothetical protein CLV24_12842 [Pontibacter ummariensis]|uniref:Uncharacterized protein n=1 Tax=Pontibacter ummariensis TaxID=1610492 RepID=A0A239K9M4_9BACT|nr:hypothetical protein [Pontibacter ummariensis]PRY06060.1 hypothetical protein CLV24_12842 [Pontibacter ummariensis]SNT14711.1 hypothetical protein SAMN06296052_12742 [Pontibacter ummariensis]
MENNKTNNSSQANGQANTNATSGKGGLGNITGKLQQYSGPIMDKISHMSTTQKVVGGTILALGAGWLAMSPKSKNKLKAKAMETANNMKAAGGNNLTAGKNKLSSDSNNSSKTDAKVK